MNSTLVANTICVLQLNFCIYMVVEGIESYACFDIAYLRGGRIVFWQAIVHIDRYIQTILVIIYRYS